MFRKKEDSLFDTTMDPSQVGQASAESTVTVTPQPVSAPVQSASPAPVQAPVAAQPQPINRPFPESARPNVATQPQANNMFRPANPATGDLTRNRMPEVKTPALPASINPSFNNTVNPSNKSGRRVLTVGHDILLKGEIATCDRLVIEGKVDATLNDVHTVEISETGSFKGSANIEDAEISGLFEGDLTVRNCLIIRSTGRVRGKISFGEVEIERGGELTGEIKIAGTQGARPARPVSATTKDTVAA